MHGWPLSLPHALWQPPKKLPNGPYGYARHQETPTLARAKLNRIFLHVQIIHEKRDCHATAEYGLIWQYAPNLWPAPCQSQASYGQFHYFPSAPSATQPPPHLPAIRYMDSAPPKNRKKACEREPPRYAPLAHGCPTRPIQLRPLVSAVWMPWTFLFTW